MNADLGASFLSKAFTGWKLDLLDAIAGDPKVRPVDFHVAYIIMQRVNQYTRMAVISDQGLQQLVHRDRKALMLARKRLASVGWLEVRTGRYGRATEYRFFDERAKMLANIRLDEQILDRDDEADSAVNTPRYAKAISEAKTPHSGKSNSGAKTPHRATGPKTPHRRIQWGENASHSGVKMHPLHLQTPKRETLPVKNRALEQYEAHVSAYDRWVEFEETAARLEYDAELPRDEAEHHARILCGFDDGDAGSRWSAGTAPPTVAKLNSEEGISDDQDRRYHDF